MNSNEISSQETVNFIQAIIDKDKKNNKYGGRAHLRFPPEPNGYLHIGHAKSICLNFGLAEKNNGLCNLRFDDTNPSKEDIEYIDSIIRDVRWLGFDWENRLYYASDYFDRMYQDALTLIKEGKAYVCDLSPERIREYRGNFTEPGKESPYRNRSVEENLSLFQQMKEGKFEDGSRVLRAKIDMNSPNLNMRDPVLYRIIKKSHHRTGDKWCIYPMYDYAHPLEDYYEGITHSVCTLEFEDHRPLYEWVLNNLYKTELPQQIEFARLNLSNTVMSKRKLRFLVENGYVSGWDDPRLPTISGLRRKGYTPEAISNFCDRIGVAKTNSVVDIRFLEHCIREDLNKKAPRVMAVLNPLKLIIDNYPEDLIEEMDCENNPEDPAAGTRKVPFSKVLYMEREDFHDNPPPKYYRLAPGREVRLKNAYIIKCTDYLHDKKTGNIQEVHCTYDPETRSGRPGAQRKVKSTLHWVSARFALKAEMRLYDYLLLDNIEEQAEEESDKDFIKLLNPKSIEILKDSIVEPGLKNTLSGEKFQFMRKGYFCVDPDSTPEKLVFNRIVSLRDSWEKIMKSSEKTSN
ncbi:MAG: glutamine--tRNA ligase/YqeY domain fusion protein [Atribacterota bacterium]|nr:glutamine--tRNA ligase/YqeY domain fusion protein [Atribacterota bacterium]MDD4896313.1 glutamine--tRNA ligase/YqeY domain fusion protein [Atribacterota bacterium]MDD5636904.1 glutamine--tRNA ligase/YqeY domain fusion protein [Atribacterota bacterium]